MQLVSMQDHTEVAPGTTRTRIVADFCGCTVDLSDDHRLKASGVDYWQFSFMTAKTKQQNNPSHRAPFRSSMIRSAGPPGKVSLVPSGHSTSMASNDVAVPRPKCTRGSLLQR